MPQNPELRAIVQRMVDAGESEENIGAVIQRLSASTPEPATAPVDSRSVAEQQGMPPIADVAVGAMKGAAGTIVGAGELASKIPGVSRAIDAVVGPGVRENAFTWARSHLKPTNTAQSIGQGAEQIAEFMTPAGAADKAAIAMGSKLAQSAPKVFQGISRLLPRVAAQGAVGATDAALDGGDPLTGGAIAAAIPVAGGVAAKTAAGLKTGAVSMARTAVKPTVTTLKKMVGSNRNLDAAAEKVAQFIVSNRLMNADQARALFHDAEMRLQGVLKLKNAPTDAAVRAERYLTALERSAKKQGLSADDVATIRNAASELVEGSMGQDVITMVSKPHPTLVGANGKPIMVMVPEKSRALRSTVPADEALESARASGRWGTRKAWGEQKGATTEAKKAVERAQRDAVKTAIPESKALLATEGQALTAADVLDRMAQRQGNREPIGLPAQVAGAVEITAGKVPVLAMAGNWLRNNGLKAGIWADRMADAIQRNDVKKASEILARFGVGLEMQPR